MGKGKEKTSEGKEKKQRNEGEQGERKKEHHEFFLQHWLPANMTTPLQFTHAVVDGVIDGTQNIKP